MRIPSLALLAALALPAAAQTAPGLWVQQMAHAQAAQLSGLGFRQMNLAKNAVFSSKGYDYADDRPWLKRFFHGAWTPSADCDAACKRSALDFDFPPARRAFELDPVMVQAIARLRQASFAKLRSFRDASEVRDAVEREFMDVDDESGQESVRTELDVFGRTVKLSAEEALAFKESLERDAAGDFLFLRILDRAGKDDYRFDTAELLGLYVGNVALLKAAIELRHGKTLDQTLTWELGQLGVQPAALAATPESQEAVARLDAAVARLSRPDLGDLPADFAEKVKIDNNGVTYAVGM